MIFITSLRVPAGERDILSLLQKKAAKRLRLKDASQITAITVARHAIDARKKPEITEVYSVLVRLAGGRDKERKLVRRLSDRNVTFYEKTVPPFPVSTGGSTDRPVVVGSGPAGLFAAYLLAMNGHKPVLIERGKQAEERVKDVQSFWESGVLTKESNVQFGEGGAGTFSDGKLYTSVKDREGYFAEVLRIFAENGAPKDILYEAHPHIGTDLLVGVLGKMRERMLDKGADIRFETRMTSLLLTEEKGGIRNVTGIATDRGEIACRRVLLAIGHSARDTYEALYAQGVRMEQKPFAAGFRIAHRQTVINEAMYGIAHPKELPPAPYKLTCTTESGRSVYSFCMCPGGYVVDASSEAGHLAVNGMSYAARNGLYANSAIITPVVPDDFASAHPLAGVDLQREMEQSAFRAGQGMMPVSTFLSFRRQEAPVELPAAPENFAKGRVRAALLNDIMRKEWNEAIIEGIRHFGQSISGFDADEALLCGIETRSSAPVRIVRGKDRESVNIKGLYPCGEGAGYAGGIMSAAVDGIRSASKMICG